MRFFRELNPVASHVAVAALAIAMWVFLIDKCESSACRKRWTANRLRAGGASYADRVGRAKLSADVDGAERAARTNVSIEGKTAEHG